MKTKQWFILVLSAFALSCGSEPSKKGFPSSGNNANNDNNGQGNNGQGNNGVGNNGQNNGQNNGTAGPLCGNGDLNPGELCDGDCPTSCQATACESVVLIGSADTCDAQCVADPVGCVDDDDCCGNGCDLSTDSDCENICGDGVVEGDELCDGNCSTTCVPDSVCQTATPIGSPETCNAACDLQPITACTSGDGCCAPGCNANNDSDCEPTCGNGALEPGELCDGNCPSSCNDNNACTTDVLIGQASTCDVSCQNSPIVQCVSGDGCCPSGCDRTNDLDCPVVCGDGVVDAPETCDGNCPNSCSDMNACTTDALVGSPAQCNVGCNFAPVTSCVNNDGCCPSNCNDTNDNDCVVCVPDTCAQIGAGCGTWDDGCNGTVDCGTCTSGTCLLGQCIYNGGTGSPCFFNQQCSEPNAFCIDDTSGYPNGYCSTSCFGVCDDFSVCVTGALPIFGDCHARCENSLDCRTGYFCEPQTTLLGFVENACVPQ